MNIDLDRFGILEGINEVIVTTISRSGIPNAAPIGIIKHLDKLEVRVFNGSQTYANIRETGLLAANMVYDPVLFVRSALGYLDNDMFQMIKKGNTPGFPVIKDSLAWISFKVDYHAGSKVLKAELHPVDGNICEPRIIPINRAFNAVIEAAIHATRYQLFKTEKFLRQIRSYNNIIDKCGGNREKQAYNMIFRLLEIDNNDKE